MTNGIIKVFITFCFTYNSSYGINMYHVGSGDQFIVMLTQGRCWGFSIGLSNDQIVQCSFLLFLDPPSPDQKLAEPTRMSTNVVDSTTQ